VIDPAHVRFVVRAAQKGDTKKTGVVVCAPEWLDAMEPLAGGLPSLMEPALRGVSLSSLDQGAPHGIHTRAVPSSGERSASHLASG
jgi:hypothetical protein